MVAKLLCSRAKLTAIAISFLSVVELLGLKALISQNFDLPVILLFEASLFVAIIGFVLLYVSLIREEYFELLRKPKRSASQFITLLGIEATTAAIGFGFYSLAIFFENLFAWISFAIVAVFTGSVILIVLKEFCLYPSTFNIVFKCGKHSRAQVKILSLAQKSVCVIVGAALMMTLVSAPAIAYAVGAIEEMANGKGEVFTANDLSSTQSVQNAGDDLDAFDLSLTQDIPAKTPTADPKATIPEELYEQPKVEGELAYTIEDTTVFKQDETHFKAVLGGPELTYTDETGEEKLIDNTLCAQKANVLSDDVNFVNRANSYKTTLPDKISENRPIRITKGDYSFEYLPLEGNFSLSATRDEAIRYTEVFPGIDYQYTLVGDVIKEDIILTREQDRFEFKARLFPGDNLKARQEKGAIELYENDEVAFKLTAPIMEDASGEISDKLELKLEEEPSNEGTYIVRVVPDKDWLKAPGRIYPIRIDPTIAPAPTSLRVGCVEQRTPNKVIGENDYSYAGYDDGVKSDTKVGGHWMTRVYVEATYNFPYELSEARINSATFQIYQKRAYSNGTTNFGLYRVCNPWNLDNLTWNSQLGFGHAAITYSYARTTAGYLGFNVKDLVNGWVQNLYPQYGFCIKATDERNMQAEVFASAQGVTKPSLVVDYTIPEPVSDATSLDSTTANIRTVTESDNSGKLKLDAVFADGEAKPRSNVAYVLDGKGESAYAYASRSYQYPNTESFHSAMPNGTRYKDKLSNWQSVPFTGLEFNKRYQVRVRAMLNGAVGKEATSDSFLVYKATLKDTLPFIAKHYGVTLEQLALDNHVQDMLIVGGNTIFVRNPKTTDAYTQSELSIDEKKQIDSALMGRGKHCEYGFEPVNLNTGNFVMEVTDAQAFSNDCDFSITRTYNSKEATNAGSFGRGWTFKYDESIARDESGAYVLFAGDGKMLVFVEDGAGEFKCTMDSTLKLQVIDTPLEANKTVRTYVVTNAETHEVRTFNSWGTLTEIKDAKNLITKIERDDYGRIKALTDPFEKSFKFENDEVGRIVKVTTPDGKALHYSYDTRGNLITVTDQMGGTVSYTYNDKHELLTRRDQNGFTTVDNTYDDSNRVILQRDARGGEVKFAYSPGKTVTTDALGNVTTYSYDLNFRTTAITYPDGSSISRSYDSVGNLIEDENGSYAYDELGHLTSQTIDGNTTSFFYNDIGLLAAKTLADGTTTTYTYDANGNLISETCEDAKITYTYDSFSRMTSVTDADGVSEIYNWFKGYKTSATNALGETTEFSYDGAGRKVLTRTPDNFSTRTYYDACGRVIGETDKAGAYTAYTLDGAGALIKTTDASGASTIIEHDASYNATSITDALGNTTTYTFDANNNEIAEVDTAGNTTTREFDFRGNVTKETNALGMTTLYIYDSRGRLTKKTFPTGEVEHYTYSGINTEPTSFIDAYGNETKFEYDSLSRLAKTTYSNGATEAYVYNSRSQVIKEITRGGLEVTYEYTKGGRLCMRNAGGRTYKFENDALGRQTKIIDPYGSETKLSYDTCGNISSVTDSLGNTTSFVYDANARLVKQIDALGNTYSREYDACGNITKEIDTQGNINTYTYDALGQIKTWQNALGNTTTYLYDALGNLSTTTNAAGLTQTATYDAAGNIESVTDALGRKTQYAYDANSNLKTRTLPTGDTEEITHDAYGKVLYIKDAAGLEINYSYDAVGLTNAITSNTGAEATFEYDRAGNCTYSRIKDGQESRFTYNKYSELTEEINTNGAKTSFEYGYLGEFKTQTDALGNKTRFEYDANANLIKQIDALGNATKFSYDALSRLVVEEDALGEVKRYAYDSAGNLTSFINENGNETLYTYDALSRLLSTTSKEGSKQEFTYDALGNITSETDGEGNKTEATYDSASRLTSIKRANGTVEKYVYDALDNLIQKQDALGAVTTYEYDKHGNLTTETDALKNKTSYTYNLADNLTSKTNALGATWKYAYDTAGKITQIETPSGYIQNYSYDALGNLSFVKDNLGARSSFSYDALSRLLSQSDAKENKTIFSYDSLGNLARIKDANGKEEVRTYDALSRITSVKEAAGASTNFNYDAVGNLTSQIKGNSISSYTYDGDSRITSVTRGKDSTTKISYDKNSNITNIEDATGAKRTFAYDSVGNLTSQTDAKGNVTAYKYDLADNLIEEITPLGKTEYSYDVLSRLTNVKDKDGANTSYTYDAIGNLKSLTDANANTTKYDYDAEGSLTKITSPTGSVEEFSRGIDGRLLEVTNAAGEQTRNSYDALGQVVEKSYSQNQAAHVMYSYDTNGNVTARDDLLGKATFERDGLGRIIKETDTAGNSLTYTYDTSGNISSITYPDGTKVTYVYDEADNLTEVNSIDGTYYYAYDKASRPVRLRRPNGTETFISYDENGNTETLENKDESGTTLSSYSYTYDAENNVVSEVASTNDERGNAHATTRSFEYTPESRLKTIDETSDGKKTRTRFEYDAVGNKTRALIDGSTPETIDFTYDADNKLLATNSSKDGKTEYTYDKVGRLTNKSSKQGSFDYLYTVENRLSAVKHQGRELMACVYDGDGNRVMQIQHHAVREKSTSSSDDDADADPDSALAITDSLTNFNSTWNTDKSQDLLWSNLAAVIGFLKSSINPFLLYPNIKTLSDYAQNLLSGITSEDKEELTEDALRAIDKQLNDEDKSKTQAAEDNSTFASIPQSLTKKSFNTEIIRDVVSSVTSVPQVLSSKSTRTGTTNEVYGLNRLSKTNSKDTSYYLYDGINSVTQTTNAQGRITAWQTYSPTGEATSGTLLQNAPNYGYRGESQDALTGLQYLRARYLNTETTTFQTPDTYLGNIFNPASLNRYAYAFGNPLKYIDPTGHFNLFGAISNFATGVVNTAKKVVSTAVKVATTVVKTVVNTVKTVVNAVASTVSNAFNKVKDTATKIYNTVKKGASAVASYAKQTVQSAKEKAIAIAKKQYEQARQELMKFSCGTATFLKSAADTVGSAMATVDWSAVGHTALDVAGMLPVVGTAVDVLNGVWYAAEGNYVDAAMSFASAIPVVGDAIGAGKFAAKAGGALLTAGVAKGMAAGAVKFTLDNGESAIVSRLKFSAKSEIPALSETAALSTKRIPNPNGRKGSEAHQEVIQQIEDKALKNDIAVKREYKFDTPNGEKSKRFADIVELDEDGNILVIHQVGKSNKTTGQPVARERRAIDDIKTSPDYNGQPIIFHPYNTKES